MAWAISLLGLFGLAVLGIYFLLYGEWLYQFVGLAWALALLPVVLSIVGWMRGHSNDELEEP